ncbi:MAG: hypothetical protein WA484_10280 [Solirubrobacteraceae bacterium]
MTRPKAAVKPDPQDTSDDQQVRGEFEPALKGEFEPVLEFDTMEGREEQIPEPLLSLSTLAPIRPTVNIDSEEHPEGKLYELKQMDDFGIEEQQRLTREGAEFDKLWNTDNLNKAGRGRLKMLLDRMFEAVLDAPPEIKKMLSDGQRSQVVLAFTLAPLAQAAAAQTETEARTNSTSES